MDQDIIRLRANWWGPKANTTTFKKVTVTLFTLLYVGDDVSPDWNCMELFGDQVSVALEDQGYKEEAARPYGNHLPLPPEC